MVPGGLKKQMDEESSGFATSQNRHLSRDCGLCREKSRGKEETEGSGNWVGRRNSRAPCLWPLLPKA